MEGESKWFDSILNRRNTNCGRWDTMDLKYGSTDRIHLGVADMDFKSPDAIIEGFQAILDHGVFGYTDLNDGFYDGIRRWMKNRNGIEVPRESIVFCPRINIASSLSVAVYTKPGDGVLIHTPAYAPLYQAISKNRRVIVESPLRIENGGYTMDFEQMEKEVDEKTKMLILCSPHNPVGRVWSRDELLKIGEFCVRHDLLLFADEIHSDILAEDSVFTSVLNLPEAILDRTVLATSLTKTFNVPGTIVSYLIIPNETRREQMRTEIDRVGMHNPSIFAVSAVENGYTKCDDWYEEMKAYINENEQYTRSCFAEHMPGFRIFPREGTYLLWIDYRELGCTEAELEHWFLQEAKVSVYMGSIFGTEGRGFLRLNIASPRALLEEAYERMRKAYPLLAQR